MQTIVARIAVERKLKMKCGQAATTESTNTINAEKIHAALPEGHDWSATDPRSVKSYLTGRGDGRTLWWNLNHRVHKILWPRDTLEAVMYAFHCRHHHITFATLIYLMSVQKVAHVIRTDGLFAGFICAISETKNSFR